MLKKPMQFTSQLTKADPAATQEFHFISPYPFMLHLRNPAILYHHWASQCPVFILPLHYPKVGFAIPIVEMAKRSLSANSKTLERLLVP